MFDHVSLFRFGDVLSEMGSLLSTVGGHRRGEPLAPSARVRSRTASLSLRSSDPSIDVSRATVKGSESHKKIDLSGNPILRLYYTSRVTMLSDVDRCTNSIFAESFVHHVRW